jgi:hypothetical protein
MFQRKELMFGGLKGGKLTWEHGCSVRRVRIAVSLPCADETRLNARVEVAIDQADAPE